MSRPLAEIPKSSFAAFRRAMAKKAEAAALRASERAARQAKDEIRSAFASAGLGRLGFAIGAGSDREKYGAVHRTPDGFSASGYLFIRSQSERSRGAIEAYTAGATIKPRRGKFLWFATPDLQKRVRIGKGSYRMTPERYVAQGFEEKIGPLYEIEGKNPGERLLITINVSVRKGGGGARRLPKRGRVGEKREVRDVLVLFIGIRSTSRTARVANINQIAARNRRLVPQFFQDEMGRSR